MRAVKGRTFGSMKTCGFSKNTQSRVASDFLDSVVWNFVPRLTHLTMFLYPCSSKATHELRLRVLFQLQVSGTKTKELLGGCKEKRVSLIRGH